MAKNGCKNTIADLTKKLSKAIIIRNLFIVFGLIGLILGLGLPFILQSTQNPFEEPESIDETFNLTISFEDFYVMDNDTLEKNYSYYLHGFTLNGIRLRVSEWEISKNMNYTEWGEYAQSNIYFMEQNIFGIVDSSFNQSVSVDGLEFITNHTFVSIFADFKLNIYNNDTTYFYDSVYFSWIYFEYLSKDITWNQYLYKSTSGTENIHINIKGCSYNYTSGNFYCMYADFNGIEKEVLAL